MAASVGQILDLVNELAPMELAESYDNVGLLLGHPERRVERVLAALDAAPRVIEEARALDVQLLITHHPILFRARKNLREDDPEGELLCALVRSRLSLIAAHTNYDNAPVGVNDALARALGLKRVEKLENGLRMGELEAPVALGEWKARVDEALLTNARLYAPESRRIQRVAVCGGAGGEFWPLALAAGAQAYLTGEVKHHDALAAAQSGLALLEAGHMQTERIAMKQLVFGLQNRANELQYNIVFYVSEQNPFAVD